LPAKQAVGVAVISYVRADERGEPLSRRLPRTGNCATGQEQPCAGLGTRGDFLSIGRLALAKHRGALRIQDHHTAKHAGSDNRVVDPDQATSG
jgi:hypothetical protein